jgi:hypothetical protein
MWLKAALLVVTGTLASVTILVEPQAGQQT